MIAKPLTPCVPTRFYGWCPDGRYSLSASLQNLHDCGFTAADVSLENISLLDDAWQSVLYAAASRAKALGIALPVCHLPFYMPSPDDKVAMKRFAQEQSRGIEAAALMGIPLAVIHPIARHSSRTSKQDWFAENVAYLAPLCEKAKKLGVTLAVENMASTKESLHDHLYGCRAVEIVALAKKLGVKTCWDTGHAHTAGLAQSHEIELLGSTLALVHLHDNDGSDAHLVPLTGQIDWADVARGLTAVGYEGVLDFETKTSHLCMYDKTREQLAADTLGAARTLVRMLQTNK